MPSHELSNDGWCQEHLTERRSSLSPKAAWPASTTAQEARLIAGRTTGLDPAKPQPEPPQAQLLRLAKKAFPDLTLRVGLYCDVNGVSGTSPWQFVLKASGMPLGAAKLTATGTTAEACIEAMVKQVRPTQRQVAADREDALRQRSRRAA